MFIRRAWPCAAAVMLIVGLASSIHAAQPEYTVTGRNLTVGQDGVLHLDARAGDGVAWRSGKNFSVGRIFVEVQGSDSPGRSFVGLAFHGADDRTFEAVYLRPFNFNAQDAVKRAHSIQYISMPEYSWQRLREESPGKYEAALVPAPAADSWVQLQIVVDARQVRVYVNGAEKPALIVDRLGKRTTGSIGLWVGNDSEGRFRNFRIEPP